MVLMPDPSLRSKSQEMRFHVHHPECVFKIAESMQFILAGSTIKHTIIFMCIGTDRSTGDALGPLTGSKIKTISKYPHVFGTLAEPVHAKNLTDTILNIKQNYNCPLIIAIDACLGHSEHVGSITLGHGPLKPGAAVNKDLPSVGDMFITGIVNVGGFMEHMVLQSTRLHLVMEMADAIASGLSVWLRRYNRKSEITTTSFL